MRGYKRATRPGFTLYHEDVELLLHLNGAQFKAFIMGLLSYSDALAKGQTPVTPQMTGWASYIWPLIVRKIERDHQEYVDKCERKRQNRSGATVVDDRQRSSLTETETETVTEAETVTVTEAEAVTETQAAEPARKGFTPPTVEEINAFCLQEDCPINAQRFVDFYSSKGWLVGNVPMADWQASVRTWYSRDQQHRRDDGGLRPFRDSLPPLERASREMDRLSQATKPKRRDPAIDQANALVEQWRNTQSAPVEPLEGETLERNLAMVRDLFRDAGVEGV